MNMVFDVVKAKRFGALRSFGLSFIVLGSLFLPVKDSAANGAVWNPGTVVGSLGPVKQSDLVLSREYVVFDDKEGRVAADFWIYNPTKRNLDVTMGFPIDYSEALRGAGGEAERKYAERYAKHFSVKVNGAKVPVSYSRDYHGVYSLVFLWDMKFPSKTAVEVSVEYPLMASIDGSDGEDSSSYAKKFRYITHTGAYWAKPILRATFEYCDDYFVSMMLEHPDGTASTPENSEKTSWRYDTWSVKPEPYEIDKERGCVVWNRSNWTPAKGVDDIEVGKTIRTGSYSPVVSDTPRARINAEVEDPGAANTFQPSAYLNRWCGEGQGENSKHFGDVAGIRTTEFTAEYYNALLAKALFYPETQEKYGAAVGDAHVSAGVQLVLLRYLRNYIHAVHGHQFKDEQLAACFRSVQRDDKWGPLEKKNAEAIQNYEQLIKKTKRPARL